MEDETQPEVSDKYRSDLRPLSISLEITCAGTIWVTNWHKGSVIPAKAGYPYPLRCLDAGRRRHDEKGECAEGLQFHAL